MWPECVSVYYILQSCFGFYTHTVTVVANLKKSNTLTIDLLRWSTVGKVPDIIIGITRGKINKGY